MLRRVMMAQPSGGGGDPPATSILAKLTSWWDLTEASGTRNDSKGTNHLTPYGSITTATGLRGGAAVAANFPGGNSARLGAVNNTSLQTPADGANVMFGWYKRTSASSNTTLFSKWDAMSGDSMERSVSLGTSTFYGTYRKGGTYYHTTTALPADNAWHFFVVWVDPADKKPRVQIDNGSVITGPDAIDANSNTTNFALGGIGGPSYASYFGHIGPMQYCGWIRGAILTADERTYLYNSGSGRTYAEIVAAA